LIVDGEITEGSVQFKVEDSCGDEVVNTVLYEGENIFSIDGKSGKCKVSLVFIEFEGEGSFDLNVIQ